MAWLFQWKRASAPSVTDAAERNIHIRPNSGRSVLGSDDGEGHSERRLEVEEEGGRGGAGRGAAKW
jgi:hypothetical protein